jgi:hypothetical protein
MLVMCVSITGTADRLDGVVDRDRGVGEAGRIDDDARRLVRAGLVDPVDDRALVVRLPELDGKAAAAAALRQSFSTSFSVARP